MGRKSKRIFMSQLLCRFVLNNSIILKKFNSNYLGTMKNRIVMSAMTRGFADKEHCCTKEMSKYYERRAKNGVSLILTEGIIVDKTGDGYNNVPYMKTTKHAKSWKETIERIHANNSKIYAQLWHCGRILHEDYTGVTPISSSNKQATGINRQNNKPYAIPRKILKEEIPEIFDMFTNSIERSLDIGFDGVELHFAHGYLIDQFFDSRINDRNDEYGGNIENRCRFATELLESVIDRFGSEKIMIRISPSRKMGDIYNWDNLDEMLDYFIPKIDEIGLRQLDISGANSNYFETSGKIIKKIREKWPHFLIGGASLTHEEAIKEVSEKRLDMVTWARYILANPDFVSKLEKNEQILDMTDDMRANLY